MGWLIGAASIATVVANLAGSTVAQQKVALDPAVIAFKLPADIKKAIEQYDSRYSRMTISSVHLMDVLPPVETTTTKN